MYIDPITRQNFNYATPLSSDNNTQNVRALDICTDEHYLRILKPVLRATLMLFETKQIQPAISPNIFTVQEAGNYSNGELTKFWNRASLTKHSDTTLKLLGKAISYNFLATSEQHPTDFYSPPF